MLNRLAALPGFAWLGGGAADARKPTTAARGRRAPAAASRGLTQRTLANSNVQRFDEALLWMTALLLGLGLVMVYSASIALMEKRDPSGDASTFYLIRQSVAICVALVAGLFAYAVPPARWQRLARPLFFGGVLLLILVFVPGIGKRAGGAYRWVSLGVATVQPTELMKLFVVLYVADYAVRKQALMPHLWRAFVPMAIALSVVGMLIMRQPDLGALIVILLVAMGVLFLGGMNPRLFFGMAAFLGFVFAAFILLVPFRRARFFSYLDPFARANAEGSSYQLTHSLMAIGKGEWLGSGLGAGVAKLNFLPEPHTDFLFATIGEELGMVGMLVVILMFFWVVRRCFEIGRQAIAFEEFFNGLVAQGIGLWIGLQVFINLGVNLGLLPTKGLTLPFMSFGGTAILMNCVAMAIVLRIDVENRRLMRGKMA
ncbi:MAG: putative lipid II flippase FtsW [Lautropia mirabilis]|nr:putative lipid II flippase FtsW [Lautropia mirabilis]